MYSLSRQAGTVPSQVQLTWVSEFLEGLWALVLTTVIRELVEHYHLVKVGVSCQNRSTQAFAANLCPDLTPLNYRSVVEMPEAVLEPSLSNLHLLVAEQEFQAEKEAAMEAGIPTAAKWAALAVDA